MADTAKPNPGFTLPPPNETTAPASPPPATTPTTPAAQTTSPIQIVVPQGESTQSRDLLIGAVVLLVLMVVYFIAKNAYANSLVAKRVEPRSANAAGWWLWIFLTLLSIGVVLAAVNNSLLMTPFIVGPLVLGALVAFVLMLLSSRR